MTSQICYNFQACQAVHWAEDITTLHFQSQVYSLSVCGPQVYRYSYLLQKAGLPNLIHLTLANIQQLRKTLMRLHSSKSEKPSSIKGLVNIIDTLVEMTIGPMEKSRPFANKKIF